MTTRILGRTSLNLRALSLAFSAMVLLVSHIGTAPAADRYDGSGTASARMAELTPNTALPHSSARSTPTLSSKTLADINRRLNAMQQQINRLQAQVNQLRQRPARAGGGGSAGSMAAEAKTMAAEARDIALRAERKADQALATANQALSTAQSR